MQCNVSVLFCIFPSQHYNTSFFDTLVVQFLRYANKVWAVDPKLGGILLIRLCNSCWLSGRAHLTKLFEQS